MFPLMKDKAFDEAPKYVVVDPESQLIEVFPTAQFLNVLTGVKEEPIKSLNLLNEMFPCKE